MQFFRRTDMGRDLDVYLKPLGAGSRIKIYETEQCQANRRQD